MFAFVPLEFFCLPRLSTSPVFSLFSTVQYSYPPSHAQFAPREARGCGGRCLDAHGQESWSGRPRPQKDFVVQGVAGQSISLVVDVFLVLRRPSEPEGFHICNTTRLPCTVNRHHRSRCLWRCARHGQRGYWPLHVPSERLHHIRFCSRRFHGCCARDGVSSTGVAPGLSNLLISPGSTSSTSASSDSRRHTPTRPC